MNSSDESFKSKSDEVATIVIKGKISLSKSLFSKLSKHTCLMAKEGGKKVKSNTSFSSKYVTSDEDTFSSDNYDSNDDDSPLPSDLVKNPNAMIKDLIGKLELGMSYLRNKKNYLFKKEKLAKNSRNSYHLKTIRWRSLTKNLLRIRRLFVVLRAQFVLFKVNMMSY
jgi:hypothetical protein